MKKCAYISLISLYSSGVFGQGVAIQNERENTLYLGIPTPLNIVAEGFGRGRILVTTDNGRIYAGSFGREARYCIWPDHFGTCEVVVKKMIKGKLVTVGGTNYRVKDIPTPITQFAGQSNGNIHISSARVQIAPNAVGFDGGAFGCDKIVIDTCTFIVIRREKLILLKNLHNSNGVRFSDDSLAQKAIQHLEVGDKLLFIGITSRRADKRSRHLAPMEFTIIAGSSQPTLA